MRMLYMLRELSDIQSPRQRRQSINSKLARTLALVVPLGEDVLEALCVCGCAFVIDKTTN
jgi:hypothetical protein